MTKLYCRHDQRPFGGIANDVDSTINIGFDNSIVTQRASFDEQAECTFSRWFALIQFRI